MTNFLIAYPDIPFNANVITPIAGSTINEFKNQYNLINGPRRNYFKFDTSALDQHIVYDLGPSATSTVEYLILGRADLLQSVTTTTVYVQFSSDGSSYTTHTSQSSFNTQTLLGPRSQDFIKVVSASAAYRYWRVGYIASGSQQFLHSKVYLGSFFDFGIEPDTYSTNQLSAEDPIFRTSNGTQYFARVGEPRYRIVITWVGVSDDKVRDFSNLIVKYAHRNPVFLYTATTHDILDGKQLIHCNLASFTTEEAGYKADYNTVKCVFEEEIG